jgi:hypothetical protein
VQIRNNRISDVDFGIEQVAGSSATSRLVIEDNEITADDSGIGILADADGETPIRSDGWVQIYNNKITAQRDGIALVAAVVGSLNGDIDVVGNQIKVGGFGIIETAGIIATAVDGGMFNSNLLIDGNRIDLTPSDAESIAGILVDIAPQIIDGDPPTQGEPSILGSDFIAITNNRITSTTGADYGIALILSGAPTAASEFESFPTIATDITVSNNTFSLPFDTTRINQADGVAFGLDQMQFSGNLSIVNNSGSVADDGISYNLTPMSALDGTISIQGNTMTPGSNVVDNHEVEACDESWWGSGTVDSDVPVFDACPVPLSLP